MRMPVRSPSTSHEVWATVPPRPDADADPDRGTTVVPYLEHIAFYGAPSDAASDSGAETDSDHGSNAADGEDDEDEDEDVHDHDPHAAAASAVVTRSHRSSLGGPPTIVAPFDSDEDDNTDDLAAVSAAVHRSRGAPITPLQAHPPPPLTFVRGGSLEPPLSSTSLPPTPTTPLSPAGLELPAGAWFAPSHCWRTDTVCLPTGQAQQPQTPRSAARSVGRFFRSLFSSSSSDK
jgi:hypothetical protein